MDRGRASSKRRLEIALTALQDEALQSASGPMGRLQCKFMEHEISRIMQGISTNTSNQTEQQSRSGQDDRIEATRLPESSVPTLNPRRHRNYFSYFPAPSCTASTECVPKPPPTQKTEEYGTSSQGINNQHSSNRRVPPTTP